MTTATASMTSPMRTIAPREPRNSARFRVARNWSEVLAAWRMVYGVYLQAGLIHPNEHLIHTTPHTLSQHVAVFHSLRGQGVESTLTAIVDDGQVGLPMEMVYHAEIDALRRQGRRVTEYGLFAHMRQFTSPAQADLQGAAGRVEHSVIELMRLAFYFGCAHDSMDFIVGVHPRHAAFYYRAFGFRQIGPTRTCPTVNHRPVVLLHAHLHDCLQIQPRPYVLNYCLKNPVPPSAFADRCRLHAPTPDAESWMVHAYLENSHAQQRRCAS